MTAHAQDWQPDSLLTVEQVADRLGITPASLYTMRSRKGRADRGPRAIKIGSMLRYRPRDVDVYVAAHAEPAQEDS